jgi:hypothetical protein
MREKIAKIKNDITYILHRNDYPCDKTDILADQILSLPVEGCGEGEEKCPDPECMNGLVPAKPNHLGIKHHGTKQACDVCNSYGFISRPLTLGELPERARKMREALEIIRGYLIDRDLIYKMPGTIGELTLFRIINDALPFKGK